MPQEIAALVSQRQVTQNFCPWLVWPGLAAKARAALAGRMHVGIADIRYVAAPVLRHRIVTTFHAEAEGIDSDKIIAHLFENVIAPPEKAVARLVGQGVGA